MRTPTSAIPGSFLPLNVLLVAFTRPEGNQSRKHTNRSMPSEPPTAAVHPGFRTTMGYTLHCLHVAQTPSCAGSETLWTAARQVLRPWASPGKNTGVGCHFLLSGIILARG